MTISKAIEDERNQWNLNPTQIANNHYVEFAENVVGRDIDENATILGYPKNRDEMLLIGEEGAPLLLGDMVSRYREKMEYVWIVASSKHYDAECHEGIEDWKDLPFFNR